MSDKNPYASGSYYQQIYSPVNHSVKEATLWMRNHYKVVSRIFPSLRQYRNKRLLEIGSSFGGFVSNLNQNGFRNVTASDMSKEIFPKELPNRFLSLDITTGQMSEQFDLIFAFDVMEHINDTEAAINTIRRLLTEGGFFIFCTPCPVAKHLHDRFHTNMQPASYYTNLFHRRGFQLEKIQFLSFVPYVWRFGLPMFLRRVIQNRLFISETFFVFKKIQ